MPLDLPPLSLYIHIPWCTKCPYCDFNSHGLKGTDKQTQHIPEKEYIDHLIQDLKQELVFVQDRALHSIFIGGGTPSLLSEHAMHDLLQQIEALIPFSPKIEITMEANPGTVESDRFHGYKKAGINRISIGVQSFDALQLSNLGRIHDRNEAVQAAQLAHHIGLTSFNLDLMHGLPFQTLPNALDDLRQAIALNPPHLSWYQLTIEPNTLFYSKPPKLPEDELLWDIQEQGHQLLAAAGYQQYEVSAYAKPGFHCKHNLNYWRFGDYLGIGCGAHGKITLPIQNKIIRREKIKHPKGYMNTKAHYLLKQWNVEKEERSFEFFMNRLRLKEPCPKADFERLTGLSTNLVQVHFDKAVSLGLLHDEKSHWKMSENGHFYLNEILSWLTD